jgi:hypothetical protein
LTGIRYIIENVFDILKDRFRLLNRNLKCATKDVKRAITLITAIFILYNFLIDEQDPTHIKPIFRTVTEDEDDLEEEGNNGTKTRDIPWRARCQYENRCR